ncbi:MAG: leucine-rich repeat protein [Clostridiales bacterium]|jgi:hypothetical protein|nr:leucine-rich repeat protein [Clostridiales bacterium]
MKFISMLKRATALLMTLVLIVGFSDFSVVQAFAASENSAGESENQFVTIGEESYKVDWDLPAETVDITETSSEEMAMAEVLFDESLQEATEAGLEIADDTEFADDTSYKAESEPGNENDEESLSDEMVALDETNSVLEFTNVGKYVTITDCNDYATQEQIEAELRNIENAGYLITYIGDFAFTNCDWLESIALPDTIIEIGNYAFYDCNFLRDITLPSKVEKLGSIFIGQTLVTTITIPKTVKEMVSAFANTKYLYNVSFEDGIKKIPDQALSLATSVTTVILPDSVTDIGQYAFNGASELANISRDGIGGAIIPSEVKSIGNDAFYHTAITSLKFEASSDKYFPQYIIGYRAFEECQNLKSIEFSTNIKGIGDYAFAGCTLLQNLELPTTITEIGSGVFENCSRLEDFALPPKVESIGSNFISGTRISAIIIPKTLTEVNIIGNNGPFSGVSNLTHVIFEDGTKKIPDYVLYDASSIVSVVFPDSVTEIGYYAFNGASSLRYMNSNNEVIIPSEIKAIGYYSFSNTAISKVKFEESNDKYFPSYVIQTGAFANCQSLREVEFSTNIKGIGDSAFSDCPLLNDLEFPDTITEIGNQAFSGCTRYDNFTFPAKVEKLGYEILKGTRISSVIIPKTATVMNFASSLLGPFSGADYLEKVIFEDGTKKIPDYALYGAQSVTSAILPESVTEIGRYAFNGASSLKAVNASGEAGVIILPEIKAIGDYAFSNSSISSIKFEKSSDRFFPQYTIGSYAFSDCQNLREVEFSENIKGIGDSTFAGCIALDNLAFPDTITDIGDRAFEGCIRYENFTLPLKVEKLGINIISGTRVPSITIPKTIATMAYSGYDGALSGAKYLTHVTFEDGIKRIPDYSLYYAQSVTSASLPESAIEIGNYSFCNASSLVDVNSDGVTGVVIQPEVKSIGILAFSATPIASVKFNSSADKYFVPYKIGDGAFSHCQNLRSVEFSANINGIGREAFNGCIKLDNIDFPSTITEIDNYAFNGCSRLENFTLPTKVKTLGFHIISGTGVASLTIPKTATNINAQAFEATEYLTSVTFESGTKKICDYMLYGAQSTTEVVIPDSVTEIGFFSFYGMSSLDRLYIPPSVITISVDAFTERSKNFAIIGELDSYARSYAEDNGIPFISKEENYVTLNADDKTDTDTISIFGLASPGKEVRIYDGNTLIANLKTNKSGRYNGSVKLVDCVDNSWHKISAKVSSNAGDGVASKMILFQINAPQVTSFHMLHNGQKINLITADGRRQTLTFQPGSIFTFEVKIANADTVERLFIYSERDGIDSRLEAKYDRKRDVFIASGMFNDDPNYVPGSISLKLLTRFKQYEADFSKTYTLEELQALRDQQSDEWRNATVQVIESSDGKAEYVLTLDDSSKTRINAKFEHQDNVSYTHSQLIANGYTRVGDSTKYYKLVYPDLDLLDLTDEFIEVSQTWVDIGSKTLDYFSVMESLDMGSLPSGLEYLLGGLDTLLDYADALDKIDKGVRTGKINEETARQLRKRAGDITLSTGFVNVLISLGSSLATSFFGGPFGWAGLGIALTGIVVSKSWDYISSYYLDLILSQYRLSIGGYIIIIDPSGYIYEAVTSNRLSGVTTTAYYKASENDTPVVWDASEWDQYNPLTTDAEGRYAWDVPEGLWQVKAEKPGYSTVYSEWMPVPPPQTDVNFALVSTSAPEISRLNVYSSYAEVEFSQYMDPATITASSVSLKAKDGASIPFALSFPSTEKSLDGTVYAKVFKLTYTDSYKASSGEYTLAVTSEAKNYAGKPISATSSTASYANPVSLVMPKSLSLNYGQAAKVDITAINYVSGLTIQAFCEFDDIAKVVGQPSFDASGNASFNIEGILPGETNLVVMIPEVGILHIIPLVVATIPEDEAALLITPGDGTEVMSGGTQAFSVTSGGVSVSASWSVSGGAKAGTAIDAVTGLLTIAPDETAKELAVTATVGQATATAKIAVALSGNILYGDADGDGALTRTDLARMRQYFAGWPVEINEAAADVVVNGVVDRADLARMRQYYAGWEVTLG